MKTNQTRQPIMTFTLRETVHIGGFNLVHGGFSNHHRVEVPEDCLIDGLEEIVNKSMSLSVHRHATPFTKKMVNGEYVDRKDYTGRTQKIRFDQHNGACMTIRGRWAGEAQSDSHVAPSISFELTVQAPITKAITDITMSVVMNWFHEIGYQIEWNGTKPSDRLWSSGILGHGRRATSPDSDVWFPVTDKAS